MDQRDIPCPNKGRRTRVWATTPAAVALLGSSAKRVAVRSVNRTALPTIAVKMRQLKFLFMVEHRCRLAIGDMLRELIDEHGLRAIDIARETGRRPADLSQMLKTARAFPPENRPTNAPYNHLLLATRMAAKFPELRLTPSQALESIVVAGITQHRDATRLFAALDREAAAGPLRLHQNDGLPDGINRPYLSRYQDLLSLFTDGSIDLLHIDPPYAGRSSLPDAASPARVVCDNATSAMAVAVVTDLLRHWQPKLARNGVALLWQPWCMLDLAIVAATQQYGWKVWGPIIWDKGRPQPGNFSSPYAIQGEMLWMLHRPDGRPNNYDGGSRNSILRFPPVSVPGSADRQLHAFEKPEALMRHLLFKHTRPGDLVFDACGCTGVMSKVAIEHNRRWVYAESNTGNHRLGVNSITETQRRAPSERSLKERVALHP